MNTFDPSKPPTIGNWPPSLRMPPKKRAQVPKLEPKPQPEPRSTIATKTFSLLDCFA